MLEAASTLTQASTVYPLVAGIPVGSTKLRALLVMALAEYVLPFEVMTRLPDGTTPHVAVSVTSPETVPELG